MPPWFSRPTHTCSNLPIAKELLFRNAQVGGNNHGVYTSESAIRLIIIPDSNEERNRIIEESYASSPPDTGHRGVRAGVAPPALDDGQHLPRAPRRGELPVQEPALAKAGDGMLPSDFFRRNVVLSFQEDAIGIRLRDVIGVDNMMWGSDYPHSESTFPRSGQILAEILEGVPKDEQAKIAGGNTARVYNLTRQV